MGEGLFSTKEEFQEELQPNMMDSDPAAAVEQPETPKGYKWKSRLVVLQEQAKQQCTIVLLRKIETEAARVI